MKIRKAGKEDVDSLLVLWDGYEEYHWKLAKDKEMRRFLQKNKNARNNIREYFLKHIVSKNANIFVAAEDDNILGFISLKIIDAPSISTVRKMGHIGYFYIEEQVWGKGIGSRLMKEALKWFRSKKIKRVSFEVHPFNRRALSYYRKLRFREYEIIMMKDFK